MVGQVYETGRSTGKLADDQSGLEDQVMCS